MKATMNTKDFMQGMRAIRTFVENGDAVRFIESEGMLSVYCTDTTYVMLARVCFDVTVEKDGESTIIIPYHPVMKASKMLLGASETVRLYSHGASFIDENGMEVASFSTSQRDGRMSGGENANSGRAFVRAQETCQAVAVVPTAFLKGAVDMVNGKDKALSFNMSGDKFKISYDDCENTFTIRRTVPMVKECDNVTSYYPTDFLKSLLASITAPAVTIYLGKDEVMALHAMQDGPSASYAIAPRIMGD